MTRTFTITRSGITRRFTVQSGVGPAGPPGATDYNQLTGTADSIPFTTTNGGPGQTGELAWFADTESLALRIKNGENLDLGEETVYHVENNTGSAIAKGAAVSYAGTVGNSGKLRVKLWNGSTDQPEAFMGLAMGEIANEATGYVTAFGVIRGIDTTAFSTGAILYANPSGTGLVTAEPTGTHVVAALCISAANNGAILVRPTVAGYVETTDARLTDARTPTAHTHELADITDAGTAAASDIGDFASSAALTAATATLELRTHPRRSRLPAGTFSPIRLALDSSRSIDIAVVGDSLGNAATEYAESFAAYLQARYPGHRLVRRLIAENASPSVREWTQTVVQAASGEFYWDFPTDPTTVIGPSISALDLPVPTGDFDVEMKIRINDWEANHGYALFEAWGITSPRLSRMFQLRIINTRRLQFSYYDGVGAFRTLTSANLGTVAGAVVATAPSDGTDWTLRTRFDVDNGSGGSTLTFAKSTDDGATWTDMTTLTMASSVGLWQRDPRDAVTGTFRIGGSPSVPIRNARIYSVAMRHAHGGKTVNRRAVDYANTESPTNNLTTGGSPTIWLHNYSYPGRTTSDLHKDLLGVKPTATATATGTVTGDGDMTVTVTAAGLAGSPLAINVAVLNGDTAAVWGGKVRAALEGNAAITALFSVAGFGASIQLEHLLPQANDATLSIALATGTATGITSTSSTITVSGNPRHADRLFADYGVGILFFHGGINDQWAGDMTGGSRRWVQGVEEIIDAVLARNSDLMPILVATNPKSTSSGISDPVRDQQSLRSALMANLARKRGWGFIDVWTSFMEDGTDLDTLIPDGTHPSVEAIASLWNPLITDAYDVEANP